MRIVLVLGKGSIRKSRCDTTFVSQKGLDVATFNPDPNLSPKAREVLSDLANSGQTEQIAVAECLNEIASNGGKQAKDEFLCTCAKELATAAAYAYKALK